LFFFQQQTAKTYFEALAICCVKKEQTTANVLTATGSKYENIKNGYGFQLQIAINTADTNFVMQD